MNTEAIADHYHDLDTWSLETRLRALIDSNRQAVEAVAEALPALTRAAEGLERCLQAGGRLIYIGAGTSGRLALQDAAELPPTFGFEQSLVLLAGGSAATGQAKEGAEDDVRAARAEIEATAVSARDAVIGIAASGKTPYTVAGIQHARERGAFTVGIANNPATPLLEAADVPVLLGTGPEVLAGSTRLAAGTAQKVALNALSTSVLVQLGGAYGNLMVGMRPVNEKLRKRAVTIVRAAVEVPEAEALASLQASDWQIREAIVRLETGVSVARAKRLLERHQYRVRDAIAEAKKERTP